MSRIKGRNTAPELVVRSMLHRLGYRFRLHRQDLPGKPDLTLPRHKAVVLVHGCFWHRHPQCRLAYCPKSNSKFWNKKFAENVRRDRTTIRVLRKLGCRVLVVWECQTVNPGSLSSLLLRFLR